MSGVFEKLAQANGAGKHLCVGLDPKPEHVKTIKGEEKNQAISAMAYAMEIVTKTGPYAACFKLNFEFWARHLGAASLYRIAHFITTSFDDVPVILDRKFGDIGATSEQSAAFAHNNLFEAVTANPYMGVADVSAPFMKRDLPCFMLVRTSNPGAAELQDIVIQQDGAIFLLHQIVAAKVAAYQGKMGAVVGATKLDVFESLHRKVSGFEQVPLLIPGVGTQGGDLEGVVNALRDRPAPWVINVSSGIAEATNDPGEWSEKLVAVARSYHERMAG